jgi:hypothetical protein
MINNSTPLISVIIRSCNRPKLLQKALLSIKDQIYKNIEVIVVNEGKSSLRCVIDEFLLDIHRITLIEENLLQPRGRALAAQAGLNNSKGKYINFLDDDDWFLPNHFSTLLPVIENSPSLAVYSSVNCIYEDNESTIGHTYQEDYDHGKLFISNFIPIHSVIFDRVLLDYSVHFSPEFDIYEDWDFWLQIAQHTTLSHVNEITAVYRISPSGSGAHSNELLQKQHKEAIWKKWSNSIPENILLNILNTASIHDDFVQTKEKEMQGHLQHLQNLQNIVKKANEDNIKLQESNDLFQSLLLTQKSMTENIHDNLLKMSNDMHENQLSIDKIQLRMNTKINYLLVATPIVFIITISLIYIII